MPLKGMNVRSATVLTATLLPYSPGLDGQRYVTALATDKREPCGELAVASMRRGAPEPGGSFAPGMRGHPRGRAPVAVGVAAAALIAAGCGGERQDAGEPEGEFRVHVTEASFPARQSIAQRARLRIDVENAGDRTAPNVAVTVETKPAGGGAPAAFAARVADTRLADAEKPVWVLDEGPKGGTTALTNTWAVGSLAAGDTTTFEWRLTAVRPGTYTVAYRVSAGIHGRARVASGERVRGSFEVTIADAPVPARVDDDGNVVRGEQPGASASQ
jgi:hypothetical protein